MKNTICMELTHCLMFLDTKKKKKNNKLTLMLTGCHKMVEKLRGRSVKSSCYDYQLSQPVDGQLMTSSG